MLWITRSRGRPWNSVGTCASRPVPTTRLRALISLPSAICTSQELISVSVLVSSGSIDTQRRPPCTRTSDRCRATHCR